MDFLDKAKRRPTETLELLGEKIEVRGLSMGELVELTRTKKGEPAKDSVVITAELIGKCCFVKGKRLFPEDRVKEISDMSPAVYHALNDAVTRVNGSAGGNSKATGGEGSSSA